MMLKELKNGEFFKTINSKGKESKKIFKKDYYCREDKKYCVSDVEDINDFKMLKGSQLITTEFIY